LTPIPDIELSAPIPSVNASATTSAEALAPAPVTSASVEVAPAPAPDHAADPAPSTSNSAEASATSRDVAFFVTPGGASLEVDGVPRKHSLGRKFELSVGMHQYHAFMANADSCCKEVTTTFEVEPGDRPQRVEVRLPFNSATITLTGAPPGGGATCSNGMSLSSGVIKQVSMTELELAVSCTLTPGGDERSLKLRAGQGASLAW
jgi:hypothetical protein